MQILSSKQWNLGAGANPPAYGTRRCIGGDFEECALLA